MPSEINRNLKLKIIEHFGSQADFALTVDEQESTISRVIHGRRPLPAERRNVWAVVLKTSEKQLFGD